jgi:hypothetical protein
MADVNFAVTASGSPTHYMRNKQTGTSGGLPVFDEYVSLVPDPVTSLSGVTSTGAGTAMSLHSCRKDWALQVVLGTATGVAIDLELSLDGTNYFATGTWSAATGFVTKQFLWVTGAVGFYARANLTAITGGTLTSAIVAAG